MVSVGTHNTVELVFDISQGRSSLRSPTMAAGDPRDAKECLDARNLLSVHVQYALFPAACPVK